MKRNALPFLLQMNIHEISFLVKYLIYIYSNFLTNNKHKVTNFHLSGYGLYTILSIPTKLNPIFKNHFCKKTTIIQRLHNQKGMCF